MFVTCLTSTLGILPSQITRETTASFSVQVGCRTKEDVYPGLLPFLQVLRDEVKTEKQKFFLGSNSTGFAALVNQWVAIGARISTEAQRIFATTRTASGKEPTEVMKRLFTSVEQMLSLQQQSISCGTNTSPGTTAAVEATSFPFLIPQKWEDSIFHLFLPSLADHLLYAAFCDCGPLYSDLAQPLTQKWVHNFQKQKVSSFVYAIDVQEMDGFSAGHLMLPPYSESVQNGGVSITEGCHPPTLSSSSAEKKTPVSLLAANEGIRTSRNGSGRTDENSTSNKSSKTNGSTTASTEMVGKKSMKPFYAKPTEEDIARRRLEKEKAKREKEAKKLAGAGGEGCDAATRSTSNASTSTNKKSTLEDGGSALLHQILDIRVGRFTHVKHHPEADRLYVEDMEIGQEMGGGLPLVRTIVSGLVAYYPDVGLLENSLCLVVCNMKPKPLKGVRSEGMVLCAHSEGRVVLIRPPLGSKPGDRVVFSIDGVSPFSSLNNEDTLSNTKILPPLPSAIMSDAIASLHTNENGIVCGKGQQAWLPHGVLAMPEMPNCAVK